MISCRKLYSPSPSRLARLSKYYQKMYTAQYTAYRLYSQINIWSILSGPKWGPLLIILIGYMVHHLYGKILVGQKPWAINIICSVLCYLTQKIFTKIISKIIKEGARAVECYHSTGLGWAGLGWVGLGWAGPNSQVFS